MNAFLQYLEYLGQVWMERIWYASVMGAVAILLIWGVLFLMKSLIILLIKMNGAS